MGSWTEVHRLKTSSPAAGGPGHAWTEQGGWQSGDTLTASVGGCQRGTRGR